jgi:hypothetical protein
MVTRIEKRCLGGVVRIGDAANCTAVICAQSSLSMGIVGKLPDFNLEAP